MEKNAVKVADNRLYSLDLLRGLAIFGMLFSGQIPSTLPVWMYHIQVPPPNHIFNPNIPGISWVDIVFPFFLFSMGAAVPFALSRRIDNKEPWLKMFGHIFWRALVMLGFGYYLGNAEPWGYGMKPDVTLWLRTVAGFFCIVLFLARIPYLPKDKPWIKYILKAIGFIGIMGLAYTLKRADGSGFTIEKYNIIILILAKVYLTVSILWIITRNRLEWRLAALACIFALRLHDVAGGPIITSLNKLFQFYSIYWYYSPGIIQISTIAILGSIVGDLLYAWTKEKPALESGSGLGLSSRNIGILLISFPAIVIGGLIYLQSRYVISGLLFTSAMCLLITLVLKESSTPMSELMQKVFRWGIFFLIAGYILDPFEGGIKKDPATPSYYYVCSGMAVCTLMFFFILVDGLKKGKWLEWLRQGGSQPMLAYFIGGHFLFPLLHITRIIRPIDAFIANKTALATTWGFLLVLYVFGGVWVFNRLKIYLRV